MKVKKQDINQEGHFLYSLPNWDKPTRVTVKKFAGVKEFQVWFDDIDYDYYVNMSDIPDNAIFEFSRNLRFWEK